LKPGTPTINRRELIKRSAAASVGAAITLMDNNSINAEAPSSGLAARIDQYDGLGLAELIAKRQAHTARIARSRAAARRGAQPEAQRFLPRSFSSEPKRSSRTASATARSKVCRFALKDLGVHLSGVPTSFRQPRLQELRA
jgi:hypothetical protein